MRNSAAITDAAKNKLKELYKRVHPDYFTASPVEKVSKRKKRKILSSPSPSLIPTQLLHNKIHRKPMSEASSSYNNIWQQQNNTAEAVMAAVLPSLIDSLFS